MRWITVMKVDVYLSDNQTGKESIDETTVAADLDGTYVRQEAYVADRLKLGYMPVHHKEGDVEIPCWRENE